MAKTAHSRRSASAVDANFVELVEQIAEQLQVGEPIDADQLVADHPEYAERLRDLLPAMLAAADLELASSIFSDPTSETRHFAEPPKNVGDFRLIREIGRGGMGIVYQAQQESLGRRVALKVLPFAAVLDSRQLQRFKNEAKAAATLHHTNIVPVHSVGCDRGIHYFAMQYIEGASLETVLHQLRRAADTGQDLRSGAAARSETYAEQGDLRSDGAARSETCAEQEEAEPEPVHADNETQPINAFSTAYSEDRNRFFREVARLAIDAAEALEHAHFQGIVHRDIKPANLLLDVDGRLWVTDFGLARLETDTGITMTGDVMGTLRYMSPEQAQGVRAFVDHRTDIYSLGATLYELLTLTPVVDGQNRQEILHQLADEDPRPLRKIDGTIPMDLELIVQKALSKEPEDRYSTAGEFAQDLRNFLLHRALIAKSPSLAERARKWSRRNRTFVTFALVALILTALISSVGVAILANKNTQLAASLTCAQWDKGIERLNAGDNQGLFDLIDARETADDLPELRETIERMWGIAYGEAFRQSPLTLSHIVSGGKQFALSPDGNVLAVGKDDNGGEVGLYDLATGEQRQRPLPIHRPRQITFGPRGRLLAAMSWDADIRVWNIESSDLLATLAPAKSPDPNPDDVGTHIAFSPDGSLFVTAVHDTIHVWSTASWQLQSSSIRHQDRIVDMKFSPDGTLLATGSQDGTAQLWDVQAGTAVGRPMRHPYVLKMLEFSPDGRQLATGTGDSTIRMWDVSSQRRILELPSVAWPLDMTLSPDGALLVTGSVARIAEVWDVGSGKLRATLPHNGRVQRVTFSPDGQLLVTATLDGEVHFWSYSESQPRLLSRRRMGGFTDITISADSRHIVTQHSAGTMIWTRNLSLVPKRVEADKRPAKVIVSDDATLLAAFTIDGRMLIWDTSTGELLGKPWQFDAPVLAGAISPDNAKVATLRAPGILQTCELRSNVMSQEMHLGQRIGPVPPVFHPTAQYIATGTGDRVTVWDLATAQPVFMRKSGAVQMLAFSPNGELLAAATMDWNAIVYEAATGDVVKELRFDERVASVAFSPDGRQLAVGSEDGNVTLWNTLTWEPMGSTLKHDFIAGPANFSPDGKLLATTVQFRRHDAIRNRVYLWDLTRRSSRVPLALKYAANRELDPESLVFDASGNLILTSSDGTAMLWPLRRPPSGLHEMRACTIALVGPDFSGDEDQLQDSVARWREAARNVRKMSFASRNPARAFTFPHDFAIPANIFAGESANGPQPSEESLRRHKDLLRAKSNVAWSPASAHLRTNLGVAHYRLENWQEAIEALEKAKTLTDDVRRSLYGEQTLFLAMAHWQLGHREKARELYRAASDWIEKNQPQDEELDGYLIEATELLELPGTP